MLLEYMEEMVKLRCLSSRPEDAVAMKVMERLMVKNIAHKQVCTVLFTLFLFKIVSSHILVTESEAVGILSCQLEAEAPMLLNSS